MRLLCLFAAIPYLVVEFFRWTLFGLTVAAALLASLTVFPAPDWAPWRLGVLAGEFGHWFAIMTVALGGAAWLTHRGGLLLAIVTIFVAAAATGLFLRPALQAARIADRLPHMLERAFGDQGIPRPAFSVTALFAGARPPEAAVTTHAFAGNLALDLFRPNSGPSKRERLPACVIVVHGGGWDSGDRSQLAPFNHWLAGRGYAVAAVSYRLAPAFRWPAQRDDVLAAIAWLKAHASEFGFDPTRLLLFGRSAGGQIAQTVAYTADDPAIRGVVALYSPADLIFGYENTHENDALRSPTLMRQYLGGPPAMAHANYESASAHYQVKRGVPPTLLVHGLNDRLVWHRHSDRLATKLAEHDVPHALVRLPWATHAFDYNLNGPGGQLTRFAVEWFLDAITIPDSGAADAVGGTSRPD